MISQTKGDLRVLSMQDYDVSFGSAGASLRKILDQQKYSQRVIIVDEHTRQHCLSILDKNLYDHIIEIPSGERHKTIATCEQIWATMAEYGCDRHSLVIDLGGGVIGDMGGYAASCYMRGIDFIQVPTTLLSQVDASVGGKLGVDFKGYKNFIGLFAHPRAVCVDPSFLKTLPYHELRSGYAEMIKHALISDRDSWIRLTTATDWTSNASAEEIATSVGIKRQVVLDDPKERGRRKILNYGHTIGHAIETLSFAHDRPYLHGEAIAIGMVAEAYLSHHACKLSARQLDEITEYIRGVYDDLPVHHLDHVKEIKMLMKKDKKNRDGSILFSLLTEIGSAIHDIEVSDAAIGDALSYAQSTWLT